jgi:hypothetical protein
MADGGSETFFIYGTGSQKVMAFLRGEAGQTA